MKVVHRDASQSHRSHVPCHPSIATSLLLQPAPPPHHIQLKSLQMLICFCGPSYSPRKSPRVAHINNAHGMPPVITHRIPVIILHMVSLQQQHNNIRERTIICARESRYDAPTIDMEHICRTHTWQYNMHRWRKFGWGLQHPRSYCSSTKDATTSELLLWDFRMGEIAVSCSIFAITECVLHRWSRGWGEVNCNTMQQATTRSKLRGVLAEMVQIMCGHVCFAGEDWWDMKYTQQ
jgi:hypothetical protein